MKLKKIIYTAVFLFIALLLNNGVQGKANRGINQIELKESDSSYTFLVGGHTYGSHNSSLYPSSSILANLDRMNRLDPHFMITLGDILNQCNDIHIEAFNDSFGSKVKFPIFNAVGNHDVLDRDLYEKRFGKHTFYSFNIQTELYIILDSEITPGKISNNQIEFILNQLQGIKHNNDIKNVFLFSHRLIWPIIGRPPENVFPNKIHGPNWYPELVRDFEIKLMPKIRAMDHINFYLISGDIGAYFHIPLFYHHNPGSNITYMATRLDDNSDDVLLLVKINHSNVSFEGISLGYKKIKAISHYNFEYWVKLFKPVLLTIEQNKKKRIHNNWLKITLKILSYGSYILIVLILIIILHKYRKLTNK